MMHGTLLEPPPEVSHIFGSRWYWQQVAMYGEPTDKHWIESAMEAQALAETHSKPLPAWKVQRPGVIDLKEMRQKKKQENKVVASESRAKAVEAKQKANANANAKGTILQSFTPIVTMYQESEISPQRLETDSCKLKKTVLEGSAAFTSTAGHVFRVGSDGEPGEFLGRIVGGNFIKL